MKKQSAFFQVILVILLAVLCLVVTLLLALLAGSKDAPLFDFSNLNFANMIPVLLIGGFFTCVIVGIAVLCVSRTVFFKVKDFLKEMNDDGGNEK